MVLVLLISLNYCMSTLHLVHYALLLTLSGPSNCVTSANTVCRVARALNLAVLVVATAH